MKLTFEMIKDKNSQAKRHESFKEYDALLQELSEGESLSQIPQDEFKFTDMLNNWSSITIVLTPQDLLGNEFWNQKGLEIKEKAVALLERKNVKEIFCNVWSEGPGKYLLDFLVFDLDIEDVDKFAEELFDESGIKTEVDIEESGKSVLGIAFF